MSGIPWDLCTLEKYTQASRPARAAVSTRECPPYFGALGQKQVVGIPWINLAEACGASDNEEGDVLKKKEDTFRKLWKSGGD